MFRRLHLAAIAAAFSVAVAALIPSPAAAIPVFAHRYGLSCQACHTVVPHLTAFGEAFEEAGYRLPGQRPRSTFPAAVKVNLAYASESGGGLPKAVVDEVEVLVGGAIGARGSYFAEQYLVDGGLPGRARDAWAAWRLTPDGTPPIALRGGQFGLDLPLDPETFRESPDHYAIWDQTAGDNPFAFFAPRIGVSASFGDPDGFGGSVAAVQAHDPNSGLPGRGIDRHVFLRDTVRGVNLSAYRYDGTRPVDGADDRFWREGYGLGLARGRVRFDAVYQRGNDTHASPAGPLRSNGGFAQLRWEPAPRWFALARYDATQDTAFARALTAGAGYRVARNVRLTLFGSARRDPDGTPHRSLSSALLFAF